MQKVMDSVIILTLAPIIALVALFVTARKYMITWGTAQDDLTQPYSADTLIDNVVTVSTRKILIKTTPEKIWPWLVQMGQGRGGFYSYDWLENLFGLNIHNSDTIVPEYQTLKTGDLIPFWDGAGINVLRIEPLKTLVLGGSLKPDKGVTYQSEKSVGGTWSFHLSPESADTTHLIIRTRIEKFKPALLCFLLARLLIEPIHFIMERKMMVGIKKRSENIE